MAGHLRWKTAQFAERKWWQHYLKNKPKDEYLRWKKSYWQEIFNLCLPHIQFDNKTHVLDAGCGPAGIFMLFPELQVTAFDPLLNSYESDLPHFSKQMYPSVQFIQSSIENFSNPTPFDVVFCMNAINHVIDIQHCYNQLLEHTKVGGYLIVTIDAHNFSLFKHIFRLLPGDILHPHQYDVEDYKEFLTTRHAEIKYIQKLKQEFFFDHYIMIAKKLK